MSFKTKDLVLACVKLEELNAFEMRQVAESIYGDDPNILSKMIKICMLNGVKKPKDKWLSQQISSSINQIYKKKKDDECDDNKMNEAEDGNNKQKEESDDNVMDEDEDDDIDIIPHYKFDELPTELIGHCSTFLARHCSNYLQQTNRSIYLGVISLKRQSLSILNNRFWIKNNMKNRRFNNLIHYDLITGDLRWSQFNSESLKKLQHISISSGRYRQISEINMSALPVVQTLKLRGKNNNRFLSAVKPETVQKLDIDDVVLYNKNIFTFLSNTEKLKQCSLHIIGIDCVQEKESNINISTFTKNIDLFELGISSKYTKHWISIKSTIREMIGIYNPLHLKFIGSDEMIAKLVSNHKMIKRAICILDVPLSPKLIDHAMNTNCNDIIKDRLNVFIMDTNRFKLKIIANEQINKNKEEENVDNDDKDNALIDVISDEWKESFSDNELLNILVNHKEYNGILNKLKLNKLWCSIKIRISPIITPYSLHEISDCDDNKICVDHDNMELYGYHECLYKTTDKINKCGKYYYSLIGLSGHTDIHRLNLKRNASVCICGRYCDQESHRTEHKEICKYKNT